MKYDYTAEFMQVILRNIGNLLLLPDYRSGDDYNTVAYLYKKLRPTAFEKPSEPELWSYLKLVETLRPIAPGGKQAVQTAREDLNYLINLRG